MTLEEEIENIVKEPTLTGYKLNDQTVYELVALFKKWATAVIGVDEEQQIEHTQYPYWARNELRAEQRKRIKNIE